jgi:Mn-dependent DtxR family transcriptional regulator
VGPLSINLTAEGYQLRDYMEQHECLESLGSEKLLADANEVHSLTER